METAEVANISPVHTVRIENTVFTVYHANKGQGIPYHAHPYSHLTMCHAGSCVIRKKGKELLITKESLPVNLIADGAHEIEAIEDNTVFVNVADVRDQ